MKIRLIPQNVSLHMVEELCTQLNAIDIRTRVDKEDHKNDGWQSFLVFPNESEVQNGFNIIMTNLPHMIEQVISQLPVDFENLPLLFEGESKIGRLLNKKIVVERFKPTVYSYTSNRYGIVEGTDDLRILFSAEIFRRFTQYAINSEKDIKNAFLGIIETSSGPLLVQKQVEACNLEVRVKRYHIGSPVHRYKYTESFATTQSSEPLTRWSKFDTPVVCFDWRHPLQGKEGERLADEPISDDYAAVWMENIPHAKYLARETFLWLEQLFGNAGLALIDICFFIDQTGQIVFGEISPDCMRVREQINNPDKAVSYDKDIWRSGKKNSILLERYENLFNRLFGA